MKCSYPENLEQKFVNRKEETLKRMKNNDDSTKDLNPCVVQLSHAENMNIPGAIDELKCVDNKKNNRRYVTTTKDLKTGDVILIEQPYITYPAYHCNYTHCYGCASNNFLNLKPCPRNSMVMFCSDQCAQDAWNRYYKFEYAVCESFRKIFRIGNYNIVPRLALEAISLSVQHLI